MFLATRRLISTFAFDVIVIGGGHAGVEAAAAAARVGAKTVIVTHVASKIGEMSCNPSFGGVGKGILIREIDALDGVCGRACDEAGIHFRLLNATKGPAVYGPRAQIDRTRYKQALKRILTQETPYMENLTIFEGAVEDLIVSSTGKIEGVKLVRSTHTIGPIVDDPQCEISEKIKDHVTLEAKAVIITTGTFLGGMIRIGADCQPGGRIGDRPSRLSETLRQLNFRLGRLRTGTPPRLDARSIDFSKMAPQRSDATPYPFSYMSDSQKIAERCTMGMCYQTRTNKATHQIVKENMHLAHHFIRETAKGPRYCPSLEAKVERFGDRDEHIIWMEPETVSCMEYIEQSPYGPDYSRPSKDQKGFSNVISTLCSIKPATYKSFNESNVDHHMEHPSHNHYVVYPNGLSMSLPADVQILVLRSIKGLEKVEMTQVGYGVSYDYVDPTQLLPTMQARNVRGLFLAGQINGTTGYEEAAAQGIIAGANAALLSMGSKKSLVLDRATAYIGVLIDDLITRGVTEPYRMFTSRAEFRTILRPDNADARLTKLGIEIGLVCDPKRISTFQKSIKRIEIMTNVLKSINLTPHQWARRRLPVGDDGEIRSAHDVLCRSDVTRDSLNFSVGDLIHSKLNLLETSNLLDTKVIEDPKLTDECNGIEPKFDGSMISTYDLDIMERIRIDSFYKSIICIQNSEVKLYQKESMMALPVDLDYSGLTFLSKEVRNRLEEVRPASIAAIKHMEGISPDAVVRLMRYISTDRSEASVNITGLTNQ